VKFYDQGTYEDPQFGRTSEKYFDLSEYLNNGTISEYYGNYKLKILILERLFNDDIIYNNFTLEEFSINIDSYVDANSEDKQAWITDPGNKVTDGDGWSDYYEIYGRGEHLMTNLKLNFSWNFIF